MIKKALCLIFVLILLMSIVPLSIAQQDSGTISELDTPEKVSEDDSDLSQEILDLEDYVNNDEDLKQEGELNFEKVNVGWFSALFNKAKNAERKLQKAEVRLAELDALVESGDVDEVRLESARERYQKALQKAESASEKIKERSDEASKKVKKKILRHNLRSKEVSDKLLEKADTLPEEARDRVRANIERYEQKREEFQSKFEDVTGDDETQQLHRLRFKKEVKKTLHRLEIIETHLNRLEEQGHDVSDVRIRIDDAVSRLNENLNNAQTLDDFKEIRLTLQETNDFIKEVRGKLSDLDDNVNEEDLGNITKTIREKHEEVLREVIKRLDEQDVDHARARKAIETILESKDGELKQKLRDVREVERKDLRKRVERRVEIREKDGETEVRTREEVKDKDGKVTRVETRIRERDGKTEVETRVKSESSERSSSDDKSGEDSKE